MNLKLFRKIMLCTSDFNKKDLCPYPSLNLGVCRGPQLSIQLKLQGFVLAFCYYFCESTFGMNKLHGMEYISFFIYIFVVDCQSIFFFPLYRFSLAPRFWLFFFFRWYSSWCIQPHSLHQQFGSIHFGIKVSDLSIGGLLSTDLFIQFPSLLFPSGIR